MCQACGYEDTLETLNDMILSGDYDWALDTLEGIRDWVSLNEHVTDAQARTVSNIEGRGRQDDYF